MYAVKAIYDGVNFKPKQPIPVKEQYEVVITFIEPIKEVTGKNSHFLREPDLTKIPTIGEWDGMAVIPDDFSAWHKRMKEALALSMDEELPEIYFQRSKDMRPPLNFDA